MENKTAGVQPASGPTIFIRFVSHICTQTHAHKHARALVCYSFFAFVYRICAYTSSSSSSCSSSLDCALSSLLLLLLLLVVVVVLLLLFLYSAVDLLWCAFTFPHTTACKVKHFNRVKKNLSKLAQNIFI